MSRMARGLMSKNRFVQGCFTVLAVLYMEAQRTWWMYQDHRESKKEK